MPHRRTLAAASLGGVALLTFGRAKAQPPAFALPFNTPGDGAVNSWILAGPDSIAIIDCQRTIPEAEAMLARVRTLGRPVEAILLTHEHADHVAGLQAVVRAFPDAPVLASAATRDAMAAAKPALLPLLARFLGPAAPTDIPAPTRLIADGQTLRLAGRDWRVDEHGPGEALSLTTLHAPAEGLLIASDLVGNRVIPYLLEARTGAWLAQLAGARGRYPERTITLCGHGTPAGLGLLIDEQIAYLEAFRGFVRAALSGRRSLDDAGRAEVAAAHAARFPGWPRVVPLPDLVLQNADAVARELAG
jgi:glyoxylase-like metal-dependent hydrolase (beta-lactamase superfamily II)